MSKVVYNRRWLLAQLSAGTSLLTLAGCDLFDGMLETGQIALVFHIKACHQLVV